MIKNVFITGASGCVGHYLIDECLKHENLHLHLLIRDKRKLKVKNIDESRVTIHEVDFLNIETLAPIISNMHYVIHAITSWGADDITYKINVEKTKWLFETANKGPLERIIYFSTASILGKGNKTIVEAEKYGSGYVRTKYQAHQMLQSLSMKDKITTVFPTLVIGGDQHYPQSHISSGIYPNLKQIKIMLPFYIKGAFHFLHTADIAQVTVHLMLNPHEKAEYALGQQSQTLKQSLKDLASVFQLRQWLQIRISRRLLMALATILRIKVGPWERYCIQNSNMVFDVVRPEDFGVKSKFPDFNSVLEDIKSWSSKANT